MSQYSVQYVHKRKENYRIKSCCLFFSILLIATSCSCYHEKLFPSSKNPKEFIYQKNIYELKNIIKNEFESDLNPDIEDIFYRKMRAYTINYQFGLDSIFEKTENKNDIVLSYDFSNRPILGYSDVYFKGKRPLLYDANGFHLHLSAIDNLSTKVEVTVIMPRVVIGNQIFYIPSHRGWRYKKVTPTTIEEYKILYRIGKVLGIKMQPILMPDGRY